jgi:hypothetical protein
MLRVVVAKRRHRTTGIQAAQVALAAQLDAWRDQLGADEYAVLVDLHGRRLDEERGLRLLADHHEYPNEEEALAA